ncbi:hypothetical protein ADUPG1_010355, partial [Aduncisulcus paluster]
MIHLPPQHDHLPSQPQFDGLSENTEAGEHHDEDNPPDFNAMVPPKDFIPSIIKEKRLHSTIHGFRDELSNIGISSLISETKKESQEDIYKLSQQYHDGGHYLEELKKCSEADLKSLTYAGDISKRRKWEVTEEKRQEYVPLPDTFLFNQIHGSGNELVSLKQNTEDILDEVGKERRKEGEQREVEGDQQGGGDQQSSLLQKRQLGILLMDEDEYQHEVEIHKAHIEAHPLSHDPYIDLSHLYSGRGNVSEAISCLKKGIQVLSKEQNERKEKEKEKEEKKESEISISSSSSSSSSQLTKFRTRPRSLATSAAATSLSLSILFLEYLSLLSNDPLEKLSIYRQALLIIPFSEKIWLSYLSFSFSNNDTKRHLELCVKALTHVRYSIPIARTESIFRLANDNNSNNNDNNVVEKNGIYDIPNVIIGSVMNFIDRCFIDLRLGEKKEEKEERFIVGGRRSLLLGFTIGKKFSSIIDTMNGIIGTIDRVLLYNSKNVRSNTLRLMERKEEKEEKEEEEVIVKRKKKIVRKKKKKVLKKQSEEKKQSEQIGTEEKDEISRTSLSLNGKHVHIPQHRIGYSNVFKCKYRVDSDLCMYRICSAYVKYILIQEQLKELKDREQEVKDKE